MESLQNEYLDPATLNSDITVPYIPIERDHLKISLIGSFIPIVIIIAAIIILTMTGKIEELPEQIQYIVYSGAIIIIILILFLSIKNHYKKAYALRQLDIQYRSGYIWQEETIIPFNRIQHCEINRGPLERLFNLASLKVYTAGGSSSDLTIPGLRPEIAQDLKNFIVGNASSYEEE